MNLLSLLKSVAPTIDFENEKHLVSGGYLDSVGIVSIVVECSAEYDIEFPLEELTQDNFESYENIEKMVRTLIDAQKSSGNT